MILPLIYLTRTGVQWVVGFCAKPAFSKPFYSPLLPIITMETVQKITKETLIGDIVNWEEVGEI